MAVDAREIAERFLSYLQRGDKSQFLAVCESGLVTHGTSMEYDALPNRLVQYGIERLDKVRADNQLAFPEIKYTINDLIDHGTTIEFRWTATGVHRGPLAWVPPTGRTITLTGTCRMAVQSEKVSEIWLDFDLYSLLEQMGRICARPGESIGNALAVNRAAMDRLRAAIVRRETAVAGFDATVLHASVRTYGESLEAKVFRFAGEIAPLLACLRDLFPTIDLTVDAGTSQGWTTTFRGMLIARARFTHVIRCGFEASGEHVARCWLEIMPPPTIKEYMK